MRSPPISFTTHYSVLNTMAQQQQQKTNTITLHYYEPKKDKVGADILDDNGEQLMIRKEFRVDRAAPSGDLRKECREIALRYDEMNIERAAEVELPDIPDVRAGEDENRKFIEFCKKDVEGAKEQVRARSLSRDQADECTREIARTIVDRITLNGRQKELVTEDHNGDFWRGQDHEQLERFVSSFRGSNAV